jgi:hypothetical protein
MSQLQIHPLAHTVIADPVKLRNQLVSHIQEVPPPPGGTLHCWLWTGRLNNAKSGNYSGGGYGLVRHGGKTIACHHAMLVLIKGPPQPGQEACHDPGCQSPACINPAHLRWDTHAENMAMSVGGTATDHPGGDVRVFTDAQVLGILAAFHQRICNIHGRARDLHRNLHVVRPVAKDETHGA